MIQQLTLSGNLENICNAKKEDKNSGFINLKCCKSPPKRNKKQKNHTDKVVEKGEKVLKMFK